MKPADPDPTSSQDVGGDELQDTDLGDYDDAAAWQLQRPVAKRAALTQESSVARVLPLTDLEISPPTRQRYRVPLRKSLGEFRRHWELLYTFVERDIKVRYKQAALGAFWAIVQPIMLMVVFTFVFGRIARVGSEQLPYTIFAYTALVPWGMFSGAVSYGTNAIIGNSGTIRKIWCPREIFPFSSVASALFDFGISTIILFVMLLAYRFLPAKPSVVFPSVTLVAYPLLILVLLLFTSMLAMIVSAITVYFRDTRYGIPMLLQILLYATPVAYSLDLVGGALPDWLEPSFPYVNPLVPIIDGFRRVLAHGEWPAWGPLGSAAAVGVVGLLLTYYWYKRLDGTFADVI